MIEARANGDGRLLGLDNPYGRFTEEQVEHVRRLRAQGCTYKAISETVGCALSTAWSICSGRTRAQKPKQTLRRAEAADKPQIRALREQGLGVERIAKALGATRSSVRVIVWTLAHEAPRG